MKCPKCDATMQAGRVSSQSRQTGGLGGFRLTMRHNSELSFVSRGRSQPIRPRLGDTAYLCPTATPW